MALTNCSATFSILFSIFVSSVRFVCFGRRLQAIPGKPSFCGSQSLAILQSGKIFGDSIHQFHIPSTVANLREIAIMTIRFPIITSMCSIIHIHFCKRFPHRLRHFQFLQFNFQNSFRFSLSLFQFSLFIIRIQFQKSIVKIHNNFKINYAISQSDFRPPFIHYNYKIKFQI